MRKAADAGGPRLPTDEGWGKGVRYSFGYLGSLCIPYLAFSVPDTFSPPFALRIVSFRLASLRSSDAVLGRSTPLTFRVGASDGINFSMSSVGISSPA
jgi:hypothetical protein